MKYLKYLSLICLISFSSCNKVVPSGFWSNYESDLITSKHINHGPFGGETKIIWKNKEKFESSQVIKYATKNGWKLVDSIKSDSELIKESNYSNEILIEKVLSTLNGKDLFIYRFKTGWIAVKPGNESDTEINGFVILNSERTKLCVYHLWGE